MAYLKFLTRDSRDGMKVFHDAQGTFLEYEIEDGDWGADVRVDVGGKRAYLGTYSRLADAKMACEFIEDVANLG